MNKGSEAEFKDLDSTEQPLLDKDDLADAPKKKGMKLKDYEVKGYFWIFQALMAGLCFGLMTFFMGQSSYHGMQTRLLFSTGGFFFNILYFGYYCIKSKVQKGYFYSWKDSDLKSRTTDKPDYRAVVAVFLYGCLSFLTGYIFITALKFSIYAQINQGVMTSLFSLTSVFLAFSGKFIFHEKLKFYHIFGMAFMIGCAILISLSDEKQGGTVTIYGQEVPTVHPGIAVLIALICPLGFATLNTTLRIIVMKLEFKPMNFIMTVYIYLNIILMVLAYIFVPKDIEFDTLWRTFVASFLGLAALCFLSLAMTSGYAGPVAALSSGQTFVTTLLNWFFYGETPGSFQILGLFSGFIGAIIISLGPTVKKWFSSEEEGKTAGEEIEGEQTE